MENKGPANPIIPSIMPIEFIPLIAHAKAAKSNFFNFVNFFNAPGSVKNAWYHEEMRKKTDEGLYNAYDLTMCLLFLPPDIVPDNFPLLPLDHETLHQRIADFKRSDLAIFN